MDWNNAGFPYFDFYGMWRLILNTISGIYSFVQHQPFVFFGIVVAGTILTTLFVPVLKRAWIASFF